MKKKTKCYIYTRVSTAIQVDGYSLDAQKDKLRKYAEFQDMEIVEEYSDEGHSGKNIKGRQEFMRILNDIEDGKGGVDFVLVFKLSRFGRNAADVWNGGFAPYGYRLENGELVIAEDEVEIIQMIFDRYIHTNERSCFKLTKKYRLFKVCKEFTDIQLSNYRGNFS